MKKIVKAAVIIFLFAIIIYSSVITVYNAVKLKRISETVQYDTQATTSISGLETTFHNFYEKYNSMKEVLSKNPDFVDLIPAPNFKICVEGVEDEFKNPDTYVTPYVFYQDMVDQNFIEITEGRCIDINHNGEDGIEIMVPSDFDVSVGDEVKLAIEGLYDENGKHIELNSTVVGKYKKYIPFFFPKEDLGSLSHLGYGYMKTGKYDSNIIIQNIVDYVDITAFTYGYEDEDYAIKDPYNHNIKLLPVFKKTDTDNINLLYEAANSNGAIVFEDSHYEWLKYLDELHICFGMAVVSAVITMFGIVTLIIFVKYNFRRKNDNTVKEQPQGVSQR